MWVVTEGEYYSFNQNTEEIYAYQDGPDIIISFVLSGVTVKVIQMPDPTPIISSATRPATIEPGTIIVLSNGQTWKVISENYYSMNAATQDVIVYKYGSVYKMSFQGCGAAMQVEKISVLFSDTANRPANIFPDTVITTSVNGMWVVTTESEYYSFNPDTEEIYAYQDGLDIKISFALSGISLKVIQMPDPTPVISSATRPASIEPGTIIVLSNGQTWKVTSGSFSSFTSETEDVVLYKYGSVYRMSFQASGVTMQVELLSDGAYYTLKLSKSGTGLGDVTGPGISCGNNCVESYVSGTNITLNASPASGSLFTSWVEGGQEISTKSKYTFTNPHHPLYADWPEESGILEPVRNILTSITAQTRCIRLPRW
jgi:hypothetical protein